MGLSFDSFTTSEAVIMIVVAALLGACIGSFINNLAWRMVRERTALKGRSECPQCRHTLGVLDLVPVFSWLFLRGKCRYCKAKISPRYIGVEIVMAVLFALTVWQFGVTIQALAYMFLFSILCGITLVDFETKTIPNGFIIAGIAVWVASVWFMSVPVGTVGVGSMFAAQFGYGFVAVLVDGLVGAFVVGGGILGFSLLFDKVTGRNSLGGGDIKLLFMVGLFLGLAGGLFNLLLSCVLGLLFSFVWAFSSRSASDQGEVDTAASDALQDDPDGSSPKSDQEENFKTKAFPFGPAISVASVVTIFAGSSFLTWYVSLFM